jgi:hypothetical protein
MAWYGDGMIGAAPRYGSHYTCALFRVSRVLGCERGFPFDRAAAHAEKTCNNRWQPAAVAGEIGPGADVLLAYIMLDSCQQMV